MEKNMKKNNWITLLYTWNQQKERRGERWLLKALGFFLGWENVSKLLGDYGYTLWLMSDYEYIKNHWITHFT